MGIQARIAGLAAVALLIAAPIAVAAQPAGAAMNSASTTYPVSFADSESLFASCQIQLNATHDTTAKTVVVTSGFGYLGGPNLCFDTSFDLIVDYHDAAGKAQRSEAGGSGTGTLKVSGAVSNVKVTMSVTYFGCYEPYNTTCTFTTSIAPK